MDDHSSGHGEPVKVFVRIRPECNNGSNNNSTNVSANTSFVGMTFKSATLIDEKTIRLSPPEGLHGSRRPVADIDDKTHVYDQVFDETSTQEQVYRHVSPLVQATIRGYNTTAFAYGSTGSGKSFTMTGNSHSPGIIPRAISETFEIVEKMAREQKDIMIYVRLSYVELYNNNFRNLLETVPKDSLNLSSNQALDTSSSILREDSFDDENHTRLGMSDKIEVRENQRGVFLAGRNLHFAVTSAEEAFSLIKLGNKARAVGVTNCNEHSSRSHAILTLHVESAMPGDGGVGAASGHKEYRVGKMHLVDLAGSERLSLSGAEGDVLVETQNINKSLSAIGTRAGLFLCRKFS
jgi:hypothetical protein